MKAVNNPNTAIAQPSPLLLRSEVLYEVWPLKIYARERIS